MFAFWKYNRNNQTMIVQVEISLLLNSKYREILIPEMARKTMGALDTLIYFQSEKVPFRSNQIYFPWFVITA